MSSPTPIPAARRRLSLALDVALFGLAILVLRRVLAEYRYADILGAMGALGLQPVAASLAVAALGYAALVGYDYVSLRLVGHPLPLQRMWLPSFVCFAVANSAPFSLLTSGGIRYRLFARLGLTPAETARLIGANVLAYALGLGTLAGIAFLAAPVHLPARTALSIPSLSALGGLFLLAVAAVFLFSARRHRKVRIWRWSVEVPPLPVLTRMLLVASADWLLSSAALYVLLDAAGTVPYARFLAAFLLAQIVTQVVPLPGGVGVFEAIMLLLRPSEVAVPAFAAALLLYRVTYYLVPLAATGVALTWQATGRTEAGATPGPLEEFARLVVPHLLAVLTFLGGLFLLLFGALPANPARLAWLGRVLPLAVIEGSHFVGSMLGTGLLLLAWGLERRVHGAWRVTLLLLILGIPATLLRGGDVGTAASLLALTVALVAARRGFDRRTPLGAEPLDAGWTLAFLLALATVAFLALFAEQHQEYAGSLWWRFALENHAPRALRMVVGVSVVVVVFVVARLMTLARKRAGRQG